jgi:DNA-damage-inducible protein D
VNELVEKVQKSLEEIKKTKNNLEYWSARDLMKVLGYVEWRTFVAVINKAKDACLNSNQNISDHFVDANKMVNTGSTAQRKIEDFLLTRYACYLIAQNGDSRKPEIAFAQTYFAIQTRKREIEEENQKIVRRIEAREKLKETERKIEGTVYKRGIKTSGDFASFKDKHIRGLYGGIGVLQLKRKRKIPKQRELADFDSFLELKAKDFALAMTNHNIKEKDLMGKPKLEKEVYDNSTTTRKALLSRGIKPENLKPETDIKKLELKGQLKDKGD